MCVWNYTFQWISRIEYRSSRISMQKTEKCVAWKSLLGMVKTFTNSCIDIQLYLSCFWIFISRVFDVLEIWYGWKELPEWWYGTLRYWCILFYPCTTDIKSNLIIKQTPRMWNFHIRIIKDIWNDCYFNIDGIVKGTLVAYRYTAQHFVC